MQTKLIAAGAVLALLVTVFFSGYFYRGEIEAQRVSEAIEEEASKQADLQDTLLDIGLEHANEQVDRSVKEKMIGEKVKEYVKIYVPSDSCYDDDGLQLINQALERTQGKDNR